MSEPVYAITGATGQLGRLAVLDLLARGVPATQITAVVRNPANAAELTGRGVTVREGDYKNRKALTAAFAGVDRLLLISSSDAGARAAHHRNAIGAAQQAGVRYIAYTSMINADTSTNPLVGEHQETERELRSSGLHHSLLRNGWYTENYTAQMATYLNDREIIGATNDGQIAAATRQEYATAAIASLMHDEEDRTYELGGTAFDLTTLAQTITTITGTDVTYRDLSPRTYQNTLQSAGLNETTAGFITALDVSIANGELNTTSQDLRHLLGRASTPLAEIVRQSQL